MFGKDKEQKEFFEVFKKPQEQKEVKYNEEQAAPNVFPQKDLKESQKISGEEKKGEPLGWIADTKSEKKFKSGVQKVKKAFLNQVVIKQETLILGALGAVFLSLACFFTGYKLGYNKGLKPEIIHESPIQSGTGGKVKTIPPDKKIGAVDLAVKKPPTPIKNKEQNVKWTLQVISYSNTQKNIKKATNLAKAIKNMTGYSTFVAKRGKELVVCVGRFDSRVNAETKKVLNVISNLEYEGKKQFVTSYLIQIR